MKMKMLLLVALCSGFATQAQIVIRLSAKAVLNPATGLRQPGVTESAFSNTVAGMNAQLASFGRGCQFQWNGTLINVGGLNQYATGPSQYYDVDFHATPSLRLQMDGDAQSNAAAYAWSASSVNVYVTRYGGANWNVCSFPASGSIVIVNGAGGYSNSNTVQHEVGHYFNLSHTMNGEQFLDADASSCAAADCTCALLIGGGNDGVADTILDHECWLNQNDIAQGNYGLNYASLSAAPQAAVDRIWNNLMSYHGRQHSTTLYTSDQLDRWTDAANSSRFAAVTGTTRFVDKNSNGVQAGTSAFPWKTVANGVAVASAGNDIVLLRPGHYNEPQTISKAVTLRATRGDAVIGLP